MVYPNLSFTFAAWGEISRLKTKGQWQKKTDTEGRPPSARRSRTAGAEENAYVEQISELLLVHNKDDPGHGVRAVSKAHGDGKCETVPATEENENSFLKFDKNSSIIENFIRNFWSQLKEPTHFRLLRMTVNDYRRNKQAIRDLAEGKRTDTVREFLKRYEIRPRKETREETVNQNQEKEMAKKQQLQPEQQTEVQQAAQGIEQQPAQEQQGPAYRYNEDMVDWNALKKVGVSKELLENMGVLDGMLRGYKTNRTIPLTLNIEGVMTAKIDARLSFLPSDGQVVLGVHGIRKEPELSRPYFGHNFTEEEKKNLRESGNLGHAFTGEERARLQDGKAILVEGMKGRGGKEFSSYIKVNPNTGTLNYYQEDPDKPRNTRRNAQAEAARENTPAQKKGAKQAV